MLVSKHENRLPGRFSIVDMNKGFYNQNMKRLYFIVLTLVAAIIFVAPVFADPSDAGNTTFSTTTVTVNVDSKVTALAKNNAIQVRIYLPCTAGAMVGPVNAKCPTSGSFEYTATKSSTTANSTVYTVAIVRTGLASLPVIGWIAEVSTSSTTNQTANSYVNRVNINSMSGNPTVAIGESTGQGSIGGFRLFPDLTCKDTEALSCFTGKLFGFAQITILLLSIAAFVVAGIIYMTSAGNPRQIEAAKKIIIGALSAIAVVILGKFFLTNVVGVPWL